MLDGLSGLRGLNDLGLGFRGQGGGGGAPAVSLESIWANGEQGFFWRPDAANALYQNQYGEDADANDPGEPVGFILDQKPGAGVLGAEARGSGVAGRLNAINPFAYDTATGEGTVGYNNSSTQSYVAFPCQANTWYRVELQVTGTYRVGVRFTSNGSTQVGDIAAGTSGVLWVHTGASTTLYLVTDASAAGNTTTFTLHSLKPLPGFHGYQATSANRPQVVLNGGKRHLRFDGSNDALTVMLPGAMSGTMIVAGTLGTWVETVTNSGGAKSFGGASMTVPGSSLVSALKAVGDVISILYIDRVLTPEEEAFVVAQGQAQGAQGRLGFGADLVGNGDGSSLDGWLGSGATGELVGGQIRATSTVASGTTGLYKVISGLTPGAPYVIEGTATRLNASSGNARVAAYDTAPFTTQLAQAGSANLNNTPNTAATVFLAPADGTISVGLGLGLTTAVGAQGDFDNISLRQFIPAA